MDKPTQKYDGEDLPAGLSTDSPRFKSETKKYNTLYCDNCEQWCTTHLTKCDCPYCNNGVMS